VNKKKRLLEEVVTQDDACELEQGTALSLSNDHLPSGARWTSAMGTQAMGTQASQIPELQTANISRIATPTMQVLGQVKVRIKA